MDKSYACFKAIAEEVPGGEKNWPASVPSAVHEGEG